jgi:hypothetical protein
MLWRGLNFKETVHEQRLIDNSKSINLDPQWEAEPNLPRPSSGADSIVIYDQTASIESHFPSSERTDFEIQAEEKDILQMLHIINYINDSADNIGVRIRICQCTLISLFILLCFSGTVLVIVSWVSTKHTFAAGCACIGLGLLAFAGEREKKSEQNRLRKRWFKTIQEKQDLWKEESGLMVYIERIDIKDTEILVNVTGDQPVSCRLRIIKPHSTEMVKGVGNNNMEEYTTL